jgi:hypothetical protein
MPARHGRMAPQARSPRPLQEPRRPAPLCDLRPSRGIARDLPAGATHRERALEPATRRPREGLLAARLMEPVVKVAEAGRAVAEGRDRPPAYPRPAARSRAAPPPAPPAPTPARPAPVPPRAGPRPRCQDRRRRRSGGSRIPFHLPPASSRATETRCRPTTPSSRRTRRPRRTPPTPIPPPPPGAGARPRGRDHPPRPAHPARRTSLLRVGSQAPGGEPSPRCAHTGS